MAQSIRITHIATFAVLVGAAACSRGGTDPNAFRWSAELPAGATVHFRDVVGNVSVTAIPGQTANVAGGKSWRRGHSRDVNFVVTHTGSDYYVCAMWRASGSCDANGYRNRTNNRWFTVFSLFHHGPDIDANITAQLPANVAVDASTVDGSVKVMGVGGGVHAKTVNGAVTASNVSGAAVLSTINGAVKLSSLALGPTDSVHLNAINGVVTAQLPADVQGTFDLRANNGMVKSDFPLSGSGSGRVAKHLSGQIGTLTRPVYLHTVNGVASITAR